MESIALTKDAMVMVPVTFCPSHHLQLLPDGNRQNWAWATRKTTIKDIFSVYFFESKN